MYPDEVRYGAYKRTALFYLLYSATLFLVTSTTFWSIKTPIYFVVGWALGGAVAIAFMSAQYRIEKHLHPNLWILNILIDIVGYYLYTRALFALFFL